jgi:hypothetical protein
MHEVIFQLGRLTVPPFSAAAALLPVFLFMRFACSIASTSSVWTSGSCQPQITAAHPHAPSAMQSCCDDARECIRVVAAQTIRWWVLGTNVVCICCSVRS